MNTKLLLLLATVLSMSIAQGKAPLKEKTIHPNSQNSLQKMLGLNFAPVQLKSAAIESSSAVQKLENSMDYTWHESDWHESGTTIYTYNTLGQIIESIEGYNNGESFAYDYKYTYTYKSNGNMASEVYYKKDSTVWTKDEEVTYAYDNNNNLTTYIYYYEDDEGKWGASYKVTYTYNSSNQPTEGVAYDFLGEDEIPSERVLFSYTNQILSTTRFYEMDTEWLLIDSAAHTSSGDRITEEIWYEMGDNGFVPYDKYTFSYDQNGNPTRDESYNYNTETANNWVISYRANYSYDLSFNFEDLLTIPKGYHYPEHTEYIVNMPLMVESYYSSEGSTSLEKSYKTVYNYSDFSAALNDISVSQVEIFPNPASEYIRFKTQKDHFTFLLFDIQGREVLNSKVSNTREIAINSISKGLYIYHIIDGQNTERGELMIK